MHRLDEERIMYLMAETNAEESFVHGVEFVKQVEKVTNPCVVPMCVATTASDDEAIVEKQLMILWKLPTRHLVDVPSLSFLRQHSHEHPRIPSVHFLHVLRILCAHQHRKPLLLHSRTLPDFPQIPSGSFSL